MNPSRLGLHRLQLCTLRQYIIKDGKTGRCGAGQVGDKICLEVTVTPQPALQMVCRRLSQVNLNEILGGGQQFHSSHGLHAKKKKKAKKPC